MNKVIEFDDDDEDIEYGGADILDKYLSEEAKASGLIDKQSCLSAMEAFGDACFIEGKRVGEEKVKSDIFEFIVKAIVAALFAYWMTN